MSQTSFVFIYKSDFPSSCLNFERFDAHHQLQLCLTYCTNDIRED